MNTRTAAQPPHAEFFPAPKAPALPSRWAAVVADDARQIRRFWPVIQNMVAQELRVRYQRSALGFFWSLLNPILMMVTLTIVFSQLLGQNLKGYAIFLFSGLVPWTMLSGSLTECAFCIITNEALIRKIYLPKLVFPITRVLSNLVTLVLSMSALFLMLIPLGASFSPPMLLLPVIVLLFAVFSLGLGLIVATLNTFYRDSSHLVGVFLQVGYFLTPILYTADRFKDIPWIVWLNPAYPMVRLFQLVIRGDGPALYGTWPSPSLFLAAAAIATVSLGVGYAAFKSNEDKFIFRL